LKIFKGLPDQIRYKIFFKEVSKFYKVKDDKRLKKCFLHVLVELGYDEKRDFMDYESGCSDG